MRIVVLGAGLIGVASAWFLAEDGHDVVVVDRQPGPACETSFANGGQISVSHAEPWANPSTPLKVLKWLGREDSPLLWRLRADSAQWAWGLRFLRECTPARTRANIHAILALALDSRTRLKELRRELGLEYDCLERGILHYYTDAAEFEHAMPQAELMRSYGCDRVVKSAAECLAIEPALTDSTIPIVGGTWTVDDESGDALRFTAALSERCAACGVRFRYDCDVAAIETSGGKFSAIRLCNGERLAADACVVALGSYSPLLLRPLGIRMPVYPAKGYSITIPLARDAIAPSVSLTDDGAKVVYSRLGNRLRVAGTAEFTGYDTHINPARIAPLVRRVRQIFPALEFNGDAVEPWTGLRPSTPSNVPLIGPARVANLFVNTGHGTLGWTLAVGSGRLLADRIAGRATAIDPAPYGLSG
jgi:D-amino-acid dehydrogenase